MRLELQGVSFSYDEAPKEKRAHSAEEAQLAWALRDVTLTIEPGSVLGLAGLSGSGKSTLLQLFAGLLAPQEGCVLVDGLEARGKQQRAALRGSVALLMQYPERQVFASSVLDDVAFGPRNFGASQEEARKRAFRALEEVELDPQELALRNPFKLSGGQQRRIALAGVLALDTQILLLDEPTAGLDAASARQIAALLASLRNEGRAVVIASHDIDLLAELCDEVALINKGAVVARGKATLLADKALVKSCGLPHPQACVWADAFRNQGIVVPEGIVSKSQLLEALSSLE